MQKKRTKKNYTSNTNKSIGLKQGTKGSLSLKLVLSLLGILTPILGYDTTCPIGCFDCVIDTPKSFDKLRKSMPPSVRKVLRRQSKGQNMILNPPVRCEGCWAEHLGTVGCPPKWVERDNCLLYHRTGICVICKPNYIVRAYANEGYLDCKCVPFSPNVLRTKSPTKGEEPQLIWGFSQNDPRDINSPIKPFLRVSSYSFPSRDSKKLYPFHRRKRIQSEHCIWGAGSNNCHQCFRCRKGYVSYYGFCRKASKIAKSYKNGKEKVEGCLVIRSDVGKCEFCDGWNGWYMHREGECRRWRFGRDRIGSLDVKGAYKACKRRILRGMSSMMMGYGMFGGG